MRTGSGEAGSRPIGKSPVEPRSDWASLTVLCFKPEVMYRLLNENQEDTSYEFGRDIIPRLMKEGGRVYAYKFCGYWGYTRTIEEYWQSNMDLLGEKPLIDMEKWGLRTNLDHRGIRDFQPVLIGDSRHGARQSDLQWLRHRRNRPPLHHLPRGHRREGGGDREFRAVFQ